MLRAVCLFVVGASLTACERVTPSGPLETQIWRGRLVELSGRSVEPNSVELLLFEHPASPGEPDRHYRVTTACEASGMINRDGRVSPSEVLASCRPTDIEYVGQINRIAPGALTDPPQPTVELEMREGQLILKSANGKAAFAEVK